MAKGGFPGGMGGGMGGGNMQQLMMRAQKMQQDMQKLQEELGEKTVEATSGGNAVKVVATGKKEIREIMDPLHYIGRADEIVDQVNKKVSALLKK